MFQFCSIKMGTMPRLAMQGHRPQLLRLRFLRREVSSRGAKCDFENCAKPCKYLHLISYTVYLVLSDMVTSSFLKYPKKICPVTVIRPNHRWSVASQALLPQPPQQPSPASRSKSSSSVAVSTVSTWRGQSKRLSFLET